MTSEQFIKFRNMIEYEYAKACAKHPKFCDMLTGARQEDLDVLEHRIKMVNSKGPYYAEFLLREEVVEALNAYKKGDLANAMQELAQCGAVIMRMMDFVQNEAWNKENADLERQVAVPMTESTSLEAIVTTLHFRSYKVRTGDETACAFFPLYGSLSITEVKNPLAEKQTPKLELECEGVPIYVGGKRYWMSSCLADLDEHRLLWMLDKTTCERVVIGKVPEFSDPVDALNKMEAMLYDLAKPQ